jgi:hypothetical protein
VAIETQPAVSRSSSEIAAALAPVILSQAFLIWLVFDGQLDHVQVALSNGLEILLVLLTSVLFFSADLKTAGSRLREMIIVALVLGLVAAVLFGATTGGLAQQAQGAYLSAIFAKVAHQGLIYVGIIFGMSYISAVVSGRARICWYMNMINPAGIAFIALILAMFLALAVQLMAGPLLSPFGFAVTWTICFSLVRVLIAYGVMTRLSPAEFEALYDKFIAGKS